MSIIPGGFQSPYATAVPNNQQVIIPQITIPSPQPFTPFQPQPQGVDLNKVKGMDGAKQFLMTPNSRIVMFDENDDIMYIKQTDNNNYPISLKRYRFYEEDEPLPQAPPEYVTKEELKSYKFITAEEYNTLIEKIQELKEEVSNAKQPVRTTSSASSKRNTAANE